VKEQVMAWGDRQHAARVNTASKAATNARSSLVEATVDGRSKETIDGLQCADKAARAALYRAERNL
jgi:hypothetical protein